jgi:IclR family pca regulon transcriptional regulator
MDVYDDGAHGESDENGNGTAPPKNFVASLANGLHVLEAFTASDPVLGQIDIQRRTGLDKWTTNRLVSTLIQCGYLVRDPDTRRYRLGTRVLDLGFAVLDSLEVREHALPYLRGLQRVVGEPVTLSVLDDIEAVCIEQVRSRGGRISVDFPIGFRVPAYATAHGKVLLAYLDEWDRDERIDRMQFRGFTARTTVDPAALRRQLAAIRTDGFALTDEEFLPGVYGIGAPVFDRRGRAVASIGFAIVMSGVPRRRLAGTVRAEVLTAAQAISASLGYKGALAPV